MFPVDKYLLRLTHIWSRGAQDALSSLTVLHTGSVSQLHHHVIVGLEGGAAGVELMLPAAGGSGSDGPLLWRTRCTREEEVRINHADADECPVRVCVSHRWRCPADRGCSGGSVSAVNPPAPDNGTAGGRSPPPCPPHFLCPAGRGLREEKRYHKYYGKKISRITYTGKLQ